MAVALPTPGSVPTNISPAVTPERLSAAAAVTVVEPVVGMTVTPSAGVCAVGGVMSSDSAYEPVAQLPAASQAGPDMYATARPSMSAVVGVGKIKDVAASSGSLALQVIEVGDLYQPEPSGSRDA
jgi:hypothetical protein